MRARRWGCGPPAGLACVVGVARCAGSGRTTSARTRRGSCPGGPPPAAGEAREGPAAGREAASGSATRGRPRRPHSGAGPSPASSGLRPPGEARARTRSRSRRRCGSPPRSAAGSVPRSRRRRRSRPRSRRGACGGSSCPGTERHRGRGRRARRTVDSLTWKRGSKDPTPTRTSSLGREAPAVAGRDVAAVDPDLEVFRVAARMDLEPPRQWRLGRGVGAGAEHAAPTEGSRRSRAPATPPDRFRRNASHLAPVPSTAPPPPESKTRRRRARERSPSRTARRTARTAARKGSGSRRWRRSRGGACGSCACGVWITRSLKVCLIEASTPIAISQSVGAAQAEVCRSPISYRSTTRTRAPEPASSRATARPAKLAPQTRTSASPPAACARCRASCVSSA